jgi:hypothetical protein
MTSTKLNQLRRLGSLGPTVFPLGLGCMGMSGMYGPADEHESSRPSTPRSMPESRCWIQGTTTAPATTSC